MSNINIKFKQYKIIYNIDKKIKVLNDRWIDFEKIKEKLINWDYISIQPIQKEWYYNQYKILLSYNNYPCIVVVKVNDQNKDIKIITAFQNRKFKSLLYCNESKT